MGRYRMGWVVACVAAGWPDGGSDAARTAAVAPAQTVWSVPLPGDAPTASYGASSPVAWKDVVYVTVEPDLLLCLDARTGEERWRRVHPVLDALSEDDKAAAGTKEDAEALAASLRALEKERSKLYRLARRGKDISAQTEALDGKRAAVQASLDAVAPYWAPARGDGLGYATPSPWADEEGVVVSYATGMVAAWTHDGTMRWRRWLGAASSPDRGYLGTDTASPVRVGDTVVVAHGQVVGLDVHTGEERWRGKAYGDYGTSAGMTVGARSLVLTPDGTAYDAASGAVLAEDLAEVWYSGPRAHGDRAWWVGRADGAMDKPARVVGVQAVASEDGAAIAFEPRFAFDLAVSDRVYTVPAYVDGALFVVSARGTLVVMDGATGAVTHERKLEEGKGGVWASLVVADDAVIVSEREGRMMAIEVAAPHAVRWTVEGPETVATPAWSGAGPVVRGGDEVVRLGVPEASDEEI